MIIREGELNFAPAEPVGEKTLEVGSQIPAEVQEYLNSIKPRVEQEGAMFTGSEKRASEKGKSGFYKKVAGFMAGLSLLVVVGAIPAEGGGKGFDWGKTVSDGMGEVGQTYRKILEEQRRRLEIEQRARVEIERERRRAEAAIELARQKTARDIGVAGEQTEQTTIKTTGVGIPRNPGSITRKGPRGEVSTTVSSGGRGQGQERVETSSRAEALRQKGRADALEDLMAGTEPNVSRSSEDAYVASYLKTYMEQKDKMSGGQGSSVVGVSLYRPSSK